MERQISAVQLSAHPDVDELYLQSLSAEKLGHFRVAAIGHRGVLDLCFNKIFGHDMGTFTAKLEEAHNRGYLSQDELTRLEVALTVGHVAAQGKFDPDRHLLVWIRQITARLIQTAYQT